MRLVLCAALSLAACVESPVLSIDGDAGPTFEAWRASLPSDGVRYAVDDVTVVREDLLRELYAQRFGSGQALTARDGLPKWDTTARQHLTYCVETSIADHPGDPALAGHDLQRTVVRDALDRASAGWESAADVNFEEVTPPGGCNDTAPVTFNVRYFACDRDELLLRDDGQRARICRDAADKCTTANPGSITCAAPFGMRSFYPDEDRPARVLLIGSGGSLPSIALPSISFANGAYMSMRHELGHILGFVHEFDRPDFHDEFCAAGSDNPLCDPSAAAPGTPVLLTPLDLASVMMYPGFLPDVTPTYFTDLDLQAVARYYPIARNEVVAGDFDGDSADDLLVFGGRTGNLYLDKSMRVVAGIVGPPRYGGDWDQISVTPYGSPDRRNSQVFAGHFHDSQFSDLAIKDDDTGIVYIDYGINGLSANRWEEIYFGYGNASTRMAAADYDGDGLTDLAFKHTSGTWSIDFSSVTNNGRRYGGVDFANGGFGNATAVPVPADYDGDGRADLAVKTADGQWKIDLSNTRNNERCFQALPCFVGVDVTYRGYGNETAVPIPADYDGDGKADLAIRDSANFQFFLDRSRNGFGQFEVGFPRPGYGNASWIPVPGHFRDDSVKASLSIKRRPSTTGDADQRWMIDHDADLSPGLDTVLPMLQ